MHQPSKCLPAAIDMLRGFGAGWVVLFHCRPFQSNFPDLHIIYDLGYCGVPIFFVVSGYCIVGSALRFSDSSKSATAFLRRRFLRIYPAYWASIGVIVALPAITALYNRAFNGRFTYHPKEWMNWPIQRWLAVLTLADIVDFGDTVGSQMNNFAALNGVYWTLGVEVQFYCLVAALIFLARAIPDCVLVCGAIGCVAPLIPGTATSGLFLVYFPMFAMGALCWSKWGRVWSFLYVAVTIVAFHLNSNLLTGSGVDFTGSLIAGMTAAALVGMQYSPSIELGTNALSATYIGRLLEWIGYRSYSLYLLHAPIWSCVQGQPALSEMTSFMRDAMGIAAVAIAAMVFFRLCEVPFLAVKIRRDEAL